MKEQDPGSVLRTAVSLLRLWTWTGLDSPALGWAAPPRQSGALFVLHRLQPPLNCPLPPHSCCPVSGLSLLPLPPLNLTFSFVPFPQGPEK